MSKKINIPCDEGYKMKNLKSRLKKIYNDEKKYRRSIVFLNETIDPLNNSPVLISCDSKTEKLINDFHSLNVKNKKIDDNCLNFKSLNIGNKKWTELNKEEKIVKIQLYLKSKNINLEKEIPNYSFKKIKYNTEKQFITSLSYNIIN